MSTIEYLPSTKVDSCRSLVVGMIAALIMLCLGYGALSAFWHIGTYPVPPGLYDFYAATWGDGLFLSIGCGALVSYILQRNATVTNKLKSDDYHVSACVGSVGFAIGALIQASWLIRDDTAVNWTIPKAHHFNAPGWYHAAYFCLAIAFFCSAFYLAVISKRRDPNQSSSLERICEAGISFSTTGYLIMHIHDDHYEFLTSQAALFLAVLLAIVFFFLVVWLFFWRDDSDYVCAVLSGCILAFGIGALVAYDRTFPPLLWLLIVSAVLTGASLAFVRTTDDEPFFWRPIVLIAAVLGSAICTAATFSVPARNTNPLPYPICALSWLLLLIVAFVQCDKQWWQGKQAHHGYRALGATACAIWFLMEYCQPHQGFASDGAMEFIANTGILTCIASYAESAVNQIKQVEKLHRAEKMSDAIGRVQLHTYTILAMVAVGTFCLFQFKLLGNSIIDFETLIMSFQAPSMDLFLPFCAGYCTSLLMYCILSRKNNGIVKVLQAFCVAASYCFLFCLVKDLREQLISTPACYLELFFAGWGSLFTVEVYLSNIALIRCREIQVHEYLNSIIIYIGCLATIVHSTIPSDGVDVAFYPTIVSPIVGIIAVVAAVLITPAVVAHFSCTREESFGVLVKNTPVQGIVQNGLASIAMISFLGSFSLSFMTHFGLDNIDNTVFSFLCLLVGAHIVISFPLRNNADFLTESIKQSLTVTNNDEKRIADLELMRLSLHFQRQTLLVILTLFPWSLVIWFAAAIGQEDEINESLSGKLLIHEPKLMLLALSELMPEPLKRREKIEDLARQILKEQRRRVKDVGMS